MYPIQVRFNLLYVHLTAVIVITVISTAAPDVASTSSTAAPDVSYTAAPSVVPKMEDENSNDIVTCIYKLVWTTIIASGPFIIGVSVASAAVLMLITIIIVLVLRHIHVRSRGRFTVAESMQTYVSSIYLSLSLCTMYRYSRSVVIGIE